MDTKTPPWLTAPVAILLGAVMVSATLMYTRTGGTAAIGGGTAVATPTPVVIKDPSTLFGPTDPVLGNADAKVTIVEFSDFQCPFCRAFFTDAYAQIKTAYIDTGKAKLVYRDFPLSFHPASKPAALAAQCANDQGKFWEYHDKVFSEQEKLGQGTVTFGVPELKTWAAQIGLNMAQFNPCLDSAKHEADVAADTAAGTAAGVSGTPSFFINGKLVVGAQPFSVFKAAIDAALK